MRVKYYTTIEKIHFQNALSTVQVELTEAQANVAKACRFSFENIKKASATLEG